MNFADFLLSIPFLIRLYADKYYQDDLNKSTIELANEFNVPQVKVYDFIIVGGGTAGCVLAGRLSSQSPYPKVLLLEAGGTPPPASAVPMFATRVAWDPEINYFFNGNPTLTRTSPKHEGSLITHTGKMLGGSGSHNDNVHSRGSPKDFDNWANITKDNSWTYANVLQYFKKSENFVGQQFGSDNFTEFYGRGGPITVDTSELPILPLWFQAGRELGFSQGDPNGFQREGFAPLNKAVKSGHRSSSFVEYVEKWENDPANAGYLTVVRYANVSQILLDDDNRAYGVSFTRHGFPQIAHASKEIILSAGTFSSPLLLMKSGIGPAAVLTEANIPMKVPMESLGKNLNEHASLVLGPFSVNDTTLFPRLLSNETETYLADYHKGQGKLAEIHEGPQCFIRSSKAEPDWPNVWIAMNAPLMQDDAKQIIEFFVVMGRPKSRGELRLNTTAYKLGIKDDVQLAIIDFKMLSNPDDVDALVEGIKFILKVSENTTAFNSIGMTYDGVHDPACTAYTFRSDDYWKCVLQENILPWIHMTGTCSMGPDSDTSAQSVIDSKFRVRGVTNLRVVDASIMPAVVNANTNAPIVMIAEKAADEIRKQWYTDDEGETTTPSSQTTPVSTSPPSTTPSGATTFESLNITLLLAFIIFMSVTA